MPFPFVRPSAPLVRLAFALAAALAVPAGAAPAPGPGTTAGDERAAADALFATPAVDAARLATQAPAALSELSRARVLALDFTQARTIAGVPRPLASRGDVLLVRNQGLAWRTAGAGARAGEFVLTPAGAFTRGTDGVARPLPPQAQAATAETARVLFPLLALDLPRLAERFTLHWATDASGGWRLGLVPKPGTALPFSRIVVSGAGQLSGVRLLDTRGGETRLTFSAVRASPNPPTAAESARLSPGSN